MDLFHSFCHTPHKPITRTRKLYYSRYTLDTVNPTTIFSPNTFLYVDDTVYIEAPKEGMETLQ